MKGKYTFNLILTNTDSLANSDTNTDIVINIYNYRRGAHKRITEQVVNYGILHNGNGSSPVIKNKFGNIVFNNIEIKKKVSFLDYIFGGCDVSLHVNIDFTMSNKPPNNPTSLHFWGPQNQYEQSIRAVCNILATYDSDQKIPIYGFGGSIPLGDGPKGITSFCFALNGNILNPEVIGVEGVVAAYQNGITRA